MTSRTVWKRTRSAESGAAAVIGAVSGLSARPPPEHFQENARPRGGASGRLRPSSRATGGIRFSVRKCYNAKILAGQKFVQGALQDVPRSRYEVLRQEDIDHLSLVRYHLQ